MAKEAGSLGHRLRDARHAAGISQTELGRRSGIPKPMLSRYENDHVLPSIGTLRRLASALEIFGSDLFEEQTTPEHELYRALQERGVAIRSPEDAVRIADMIADIVESEAVEA